MSDQLRIRLRALVLALAPLVLLVGFIYHPYVGNVIDSELIATTVGDDPERWAWAHLLLAAGMGLLIIALVCVRHELRVHGDERWSFVATALVVLGGALFATGLGMDVALAAVANAGGDVTATLDAAEPWANGIYGVGALALSLGLIGLAIATFRARALGGQLDQLAAAAFVVVAIANFVPHSIAEYVIGVASVAALWPFAYGMWAEARAASSTLEERLGQQEGAS